MDMAAMVTTLTAVFFGVMPLLLGLGIGVLAMQGVLRALEMAVARTLRGAGVSVEAEAVPGVVIPFARELREQVTGDLRKAA